jgi:hypothetical protein
MALSTSHSNRRALVPGWTLVVVATAALTWAAGAAYTLWFNPEIQFYRGGHARKQTWLAHLRASYRTNILVCGGSSCATSIQGRRLVEQHGLPVVNLGLAAGMGTPVLTHYAMDLVRPGDTLIVALEPGMLTNPIEPEPFGVQFAIAVHRPQLTRFNDRIDWPGALASLRPGSYHAFTLGAKILLRQPLYRYAQDDFKDDGWQEIRLARSFEPVTVKPLKLAATSASWLAGMRAHCDRKHVRLALTIPWVYCSPTNVTAFQRSNLDFLRDVCAVMPVLREASLGAHCVREHFGDTVVHTTPAGAALRTDELAEAIKHWNLWTIPEIDATLASLK